MGDAWGSGEVMTDTEKGKGMKDGGLDFGGKKVEGKKVSCGGMACGWAKMEKTGLAEGRETSKAIAGERSADPVKAIEHAKAIANGKPADPPKAPESPKAIAKGKDADPTKVPEPPKATMKGKPADQPKAPEPPTATTKGKSTNIPKTSSRERTAESSEEKAAGPFKPLKPKSKKRIIADSEDEEENAPEVALAEPSSSMVRAEDRAAMEAMMGMDVDVDADEPGSSQSRSKESLKVKMKDVKEAKKKTTGSGVIPTVKIEGRKRRMVKKSKTQVDEKGYMGGSGSFPPSWASRDGTYAGADS